MAADERVDGDAPTGAPVAADLVTADVDAARDFYGALLGWGFTPGDGPDETVCVLGEHVAASILPVAAAPTTGWRTTFLVADAGRTRTLARQAGGATPGTGAPAGADGVGGPPRTDGITHLTDPTGATFAVADALLRPVPEPGPGLPSWTELMTTDPAAADAFYTAVLGIEVVVPAGAGDGFALYTAAGRALCGRLVLPDALREVIGVRWMAYFAVRDVDRSAGMVPGLGGTVLVPPVDAPTGRLAAVRDPGGAVFTLLDPASGR